MTSQNVAWQQCHCNMWTLCFPNCIDVVFSELWRWDIDVDALFSNLLLRRWDDGLFDADCHNGTLMTPRVCLEGAWCIEFRPIVWQIFLWMHGGIGLSNECVWGVGGGSLCVLMRCWCIGYPQVECNCVKKLKQLLVNLALVKGQRG